MKIVLIFAILSLINVFLSTLRSIYTIKGTKMQSSLMNAFSYGFYTIIVKQITSLDLYTTVTITVLSNLVGVYIATLFTEKMKKDQLWIISVTTTEWNKNNLVPKLEKYDINYRVFEIITTSNYKAGIDIYSATQEQSLIIKNLLADYRELKYNVSEVMQKL